MNRVELPQNIELAGKVLEADRITRAMEMGWSGKFFDGSSEKAGNIAGVVILTAFALLASALFLGPDTPAFPKGQVVTLMGSIITGALGFLFGRKGD